MPIKIWLFQRLKERSTYVGLTLLIGAFVKNVFKYDLTPEQQIDLTNYTFIVAGVILSIIADKSHIVINTGNANIPKGAADQITINNQGAPK